MSWSTREGSDPLPPVPVLVVAGRHPSLTARLVADGAPSGTTAVVVDPAVDAELAPVAGRRVVAGPLVVSLEPGDVRTELRWDLLRELEWLLTDPVVPDRIVIGLGHDADVVTVGQSLLGDARVRERIELERIAVAVRSDDLVAPSPWMDAAALRRELTAWAIADDVVVFGDGAAPRHRVARELRELGIGGRITMDERAGRRLVQRIEVRHSVAAIARTVGMRRCTGQRGNPGEIELVAEGELDADHVDPWLEELVDAHGADLALVEGRLLIAGEPEPWVVRGFRSTIEVASHPVPHCSRSHLRIVGPAVDAERLADELARCRRR